jgi:integrase
MAKKVTAPKEPIKIRYKELKNGAKSIYLDVYRNGKRNYEFLKLYLVPETTPLEKKQNAEAMAVAINIKAQRINDIFNEEAGIPKAVTRSKMLLSDWMDKYKADQDRNGRRYTRDIIIVKDLLSEYKGDKVKMRDVDKNFILGFIDYLHNDHITAQGKRLKLCSVAKYYKRFNSALFAAVRADVITMNPSTKISPADKVKTPASQREYLTQEELEKVIKTDCKNDRIKNAFLFSCYCGLRFSDICSLKWGEIVLDAGKYTIQKIIKKTQRPIVLPLTKAALNCLPEQRGGDNDNVFKLPVNGHTNIIIKKWMADAGIKKYVTFHTARHTFATLGISTDIDLYTMKELLGHTDISTTQIYAKITNQKKISAVEQLDKLLDSITGD